MQKDIPHRAVINAKDIQKIMGRKRTFSYKILRNIRKKFQKEPYQLITVREFCEFMGLDEELVYRKMGY